MCCQVGNFFDMPEDLEMNVPVMTTDSGKAGRDQENQRWK